jgi:hypothetical protein
MGARGAAFQAYRQPVFDNGVNGAVLLVLEDDTLLELGVVVRLHRVRILFDCNLVLRPALPSPRMDLIRVIDCIAYWNMP